ncbi:3892_t:CDS:2, partial [Funneliformis geosporum]
ESAQYIDRHARKSREHLKTWSARLRRRWIEVTGEERELPLTLKEYPNGRHFITNEEAEKWDKEHHDPEEARLPTKAEIEEEIEKN